MFYYLEMTFCPFFGDCAKADVCHRPLTADVIISAELHGLPIAKFIEKPDCHEPLTDPINGDAGQ